MTIVYQQAGFSDRINRVQMASKNASTCCTNGLARRRLVDECFCLLHMFVYSEVRYIEYGHEDVGKVLCGLDRPCPLCRQIFGTAARGGQGQYQ